MSEKRNVMSFPAGDSYNLVKKHLVHAHPDKVGQPRTVDFDYAMFRMSGGYCEYLYEIVDSFLVYPLNKDSINEHINENYYKQLKAYINERTKDYGWSYTDIPYRFYILKEVCEFDPPYQVVPNTQGRRRHTLEEIGFTFTELIEPLIKNNDSIKVFKEKEGRESKNTTWIAPANDAYSGFIERFEDNDEVDWTRTKNYEPGDIIYFYASKPFQCLMYKAVVKSVYNDEQSANITNITKIDSKHLDLDDLLKHGMSAPPQGPIKVNEELEDYIKKYECDPDINGLSYVRYTETYVDSKNLKGEERTAVIKRRVNQGKFRDILLKKHRKCCLCGVSSRDLLIASHIKPWSESEDEEKLNSNNGFLMCPNHDALFDKGYISFNKNGEIMISDKLSESDRLCMNIDDSMKIELNAENKKFLEYHIKNIFKE